jgi:hypothetical protein
MNSSYYDPLTGATIYMQAVLGTKALVYVEFDEEKQMCFKTSVQEKVARPFITRYTPIQDYESEVLLKPMIDNGGGTKPRPVITKPKRKMMKRSRGRRRPASVEKKLISNLRNSIHIKKKHIVLVPGDNFRVRHETMLGDPIYCPRSRYKVEWTNGDNFFSWMKPIPPKPGNDFNTKPDGTIDGPGGKSRTTPLYTPPPTFNTSVYFYNYAEEYSLHPELIVPVDALGKNYLMHFQVTDVETGELITKKVYVYVRSKHDAIIEMQADKYDM